MAKVLVADDNPQVRLLLATLLEAKGHAVLEASSGTDALSLARAEAPELVIVDLRMPGMDGVELIRRLRAGGKTASVKILLHTATAGNATMDDFLASEAVEGVLPKPSEPAEILRIVNKTLQSPT